MTLRTTPRRAFLHAAGAGGAALLTGCSPFKVVNALVSSQSYDARNDIAYGGHPRQKLDVYRPVDVKEAAPVVVFFYGGNWDAGERRNYLFAGEALASKG